MRQLPLGLLGLGLILALLAGCEALTRKDSVLPMSATTGKDFIVAFQGDRVPLKVREELAAAGGEVKRILSEIGAVVATAKSDAFAAKAAALREVVAVIPDATLSLLVPETRQADFTEESIGDAEPRFYLQWDMRAIAAPGAWDAGYTGLGARVAILDTGIDLDHPDLAPNLNLALSTSFVPGEPSADDSNGHGSNVAGIVAAARNGWGAIGVAPKAELVAVKILAGNGSGSFSWLLDGILYAVSVDADVINMSLGAYVPRRGFVDTNGTWVGANEVAGFVDLVKKAIDFAVQQGTLVIATAADSMINMTDDQEPLHVPSDCGASLNISATGPLGQSFNPDINLDVAGVYLNRETNVDLAAPGGNTDETRPGPFSHAHDFVFNCSNDGRFMWAAGTSQAAPHVAGVAALVIERYGHSLSPSQIEAILCQTTDDLGKPGRDPFYGYGRVNATRAIR